jgi:heme/copper-type cytochrome/quinol oxidase subunit 4
MESNKKTSIAMNTSGSMMWTKRILSGFVVIPMLTVFPFMIMLDDFIPSAALQTAAVVFAIFSVTVYMAVILFSPVEGSRRNWFTVKNPFNPKSVCLLISAMLMGGVMGYEFVHGPISFALHHATKTQHGYVVENVVGVHRASRVLASCKVSALLEHHYSIFVKRHVCNITENEALGLKGGGKVKLIGSVSRYGVQMKQYKIVHFNTPSLGIAIPPPVGTLSDLMKRTPTMSTIKANE